MMKSLQLSLLGLNIFLIVLIALLEQRMSIMFWGGTWITLGSLLITKVFVRRAENSLAIFYIFFSSYFLFSFLCNFFYVKDPSTDYFYALDSLHFYEYSNMLGNLASLNEVVVVSFNDFLSAEWKAFALLIGIVSFISNAIDENNIIVQKLIPVFFSSLILPFLYNIACNYLSKRNSFIVSIIYGFFSYSLFYSAVYVRDTPIGFLFIVMIYVFYMKPSYNKIILLCLLSIIVGFFRPEHGVFSLVFLVAYVYFFLKEYKSPYKIILVAFGGLLSLVFISGELSQFYELINSTSDRYLDNSLDNGEVSSLGVTLLKLPWGIRQVSAGLFSQIIPFPFYTTVVNNGYGFIPLMVAALFWFFIWTVLIQTLITKKHRVNIDLKIWAFLIIAFVLVLGNSVNVDTRRIMAVYPVFYLVSMKTFISLQVVERRNIIFLSLLTYSLLLLLYLMLKF